MLEKQMAKEKRKRRIQEQGHDSSLVTNFLTTENETKLVRIHCN